MKIKLINKNLFQNKGFSMIEVLFYISIFIVLFLVIINSIVIMTKAFQETTINIQLTKSSNVMEKITREIRQANSVLSFASSDLSLNSQDEAQVYKSVRFVLSGTDVEFYENDVLIGNLNSPNVSISSLVFEQITTATGSGIKIFYRVTSNNYASDNNEDFYDTVMLRGDY